MTKIINSELTAEFPISKPLTEDMMDDVKDFFRKYAEKWDVIMSVSYRGEIIFSNIEGDTK